MNKTTKWYARPLYAVMALALVAGLMMVPAVVPGTPAVGPSIVQADAAGVNITSPNTTSPICVGPNGTFTVSGNVTADAGGTGRITFYLNETKVKAEDIVFSNGTTPWLVSIELSNQPEGNYTLNATAEQPPVTGTPIVNTTQPGAVKVDATPPVGVNIIAPNATSVWKADSSHNISWNNTSIVDNMSGLKTNPISLEWSNDNGTHWETLTNGTLNNGTYPWTVNVTASEKCLVKITATDNATNTASFTTGTFTIYPMDITPPTITLNAPATDANITGSYTLNATATDAESGVASVKFAHSTDGVNWTTIGTSTNTTTPYLFSWNTTAVTDGAKLTVKATATNGAGATNSDTATNVTVDNSVPTVELTAPPNGKIFGGNYTCNATASDEHSGISKVYFYNSTDGVNWDEIGNTTTSPYNVTWNTSSIACNKTVQVKAQAVNGANLTKNSTAATNITVDNTDPSVSASALTSPTGNETWKVNTTQNITWNSTAINDTCSGLKDNLIKLEYSFDGGSTWSTINATDNDDGSYSWLVPGPVSNITKVKITAEDEAGNTNFTTSENFTMYAIIDTTPPTVTLTYPASGDKLTDTVNVTATANDPQSGISKVCFYNCTAGCTNVSNWTSIGSDNSTPYSFQWDTAGINATDVQVKAIATNGVGVNSTEDIHIGITVDNTPPTVNITTPVNASWVGGSAYPVIANATDNLSGISSVVFRYSTDAGGNWSSIVNGTETAGNWSIAWDTVGITENINVTLNATATNGVGLTASNTTNVTVDNTPPTVPSAALTYPNGGEQLAGTQGSTITIIWNNATINDTDSGLNTSNCIALDYSIDDGGNWSPIINATANNGTYNWTLGSAITSSQCLVKITATDNATITANDTSNSTFTLGPINTISLEAGWNFISVPKKLASGHNNFSAVFDAIYDAAYGYDPSTGWIPLSPSSPVEVLEGYWINVTTPGTITLTYFSGGQDVPASKALTGKKWNAIGFSSTSAMSANATLKSIEGSWSTLIGWDATSQSYEDSIIFEVNDDTTMTPGKGYWVWMTANDTLSAVSA